MEEFSQIETAYRNLQKKGKRPNFLFIGGGLSDISQFDAFALYAKDIGIKLSGVLYDGSAQDSSNRFSEEHVLGIEPDEYELIHRTNESGSRIGFFSALKEMTQGCFITLPSRLKSMSGLRLENLGEVEDAFFLIRPKCGSIPSYALRFLAIVEQEKVIHVMLEEGIGSYLMTFRDWWFLGVDRELDPLTRVLKSAALHALWPIKKRQQSSINRRITSISYTLFEEGALFRRNAIPCHYFERALEDIGAQRGVPVFDFSNTVIIATTRFADFKAADFEIDCLGLVISILQEHGYRVILRPHPAEKTLEHYEGLSVEMDPNMDVSLETQIAVSRVLPVAILGFMSSSQLIASAVWDIPAISVAYTLDEKWAEMVRENSAIRLFDREIRDAESVFSDYVLFPRGVQELIDAIASLS